MKNSVFSENSENFTKINFTKIGIFNADYTTFVYRCFTMVDTFPKTPLKKCEKTLFFNIFRIIGINFSTKKCKKHEKNLKKGLKMAILGPFWPQNDPFFTVRENHFSTLYPYISTQKYPFLPKNTKKPTFLDKNDCFYGESRANLGKNCQKYPNFTKF